MKRVLSILLCGALVLSLAACGQQGGQTSQNGSQTQQPSQSQQGGQPSQNGDQSQPDKEQPSGEGGKVLVAYYSATGNTEAVAEYIAGVTGGDLFEIVPAEAYTSADLNWTDSDSRVSREHDDPTLREMELTTTAVENWDEYDTVFIGYPIWWGIAAWPVDAFVKANDFTGKAVIPFATSSSSGMGQSGDLLAELAGTGDWQDGQRFRSGVSESDVTDWVSSLGLAN